MISPDILLNLLKDKASGIRYLLTVLDESAKQREGLMKLRNSLDSNRSEDNVIKAIQTTMKVSSRQADAIQNLAAILLVYMQSSHFDGDVGTMLNKMGRGGEALKAMLDAKLNGK